MTMPAEAILEFNEIVKKYKTTTAILQHRAQEIVALNRVSFHIQKGEIFGLVGESGSGKTTAGRLIVKLEEPESGRILLDGNNISEKKGAVLKDFRKKVQMIFQDPYQSLNPQISVYNAVCEPLIIHGIGSERDRYASVLRVLDAVGLAPPETFIHRYPHQLSGGQRQRVAIARAMILNPDVVVADEPTSMLDASISAHILNILLEMRENSGVTFLFITHNLAAARYVCDRIAVLYQGHLVESGSTEAVIRHPGHPYTQALIDALPKFKSKKTFFRYGTLLNTKRDTSGIAGCPFFPRCRKGDEITCQDRMPFPVETTPSHLVACFYPDS